MHVVIPDVPELNSLSIHRITGLCRKLLHHLLFTYSSFARKATQAMRIEAGTICLSNNVESGQNKATDRRPVVVQSRSELSVPL